MKNRFIVSSLAATALLVAACGTSGGATDAPPAATSGAPSTSVPTDGASSGTTVQVVSSELGDILADSEGRTLYAFTPDAETGESTCYEDCAANWPPLIVTDEVTVGEGLDGSNFSTTTRTDDAGDQVVIGGWPLYYFANDSAAGDVNGQGVGDVWFVVDANGELIQD
jgi:predicted lipoprotein with Yx(FWY)xxD motif